MPRLTSVSVKQAFGHNLVSPDEFARLPVSERIQMVMEHKVEFLDENGHTIPVLEAIEQLPTVAPAKPKR